MAGGFIAGRALIRDRHDPAGAQRAMSQVMMTFSLAPAVAPVLGALLYQALGWRSIFWFLTVYALALIPLVHGLAEAAQRPAHRSLRPRAVLSDYGRALRHLPYLAVVLTSTCLFAGLFLYIVGAPTVVFDLLHWPADRFYALFVPMVAGMMLGSFTVHRLGHRMRPPAMVGLGLTLALLAAGGNLVLQHLMPPTGPTLIPPLVLYAYGLALTLPATGLMAMDYLPQNRGLATALADFLRMLANAAVASVVVPWLPPHADAYALGQAACALAALFLWRLHRRLSC